MKNGARNPLQGTKFITSALLHSQHCQGAIIVLVLLSLSSSPVCLDLVCWPRFRETRGPLTVPPPPLVVKTHGTTRPAVCARFFKSQSAGAKAQTNQCGLTPTNLHPPTPQFPPHRSHRGKGRRWRNIIYPLTYLLPRGLMGRVDNRLCGVSVHGFYTELTFDSPWFCPIFWHHASKKKDVFRKKDHLHVLRRGSSGSCL